MNTADRLRTLREESGLSQDAVAKAIGVDRTTVVKYETGGSKPTRNIAALAKLFNVTTDYLLGTDSSPRMMMMTQPIVATTEKNTKFPPSFVIENPQEITHMKKYHALDERGKNTVDAVLDTQYKAVMAHMPETIAAHSDDPKNPLPPEALASIEAFKVKMRAKYGKK
jgi:DNA-binding XRE family transcriptional regulator